jgi:hypothetical protein
MFPEYGSEFGLEKYSHHFSKLHDAHTIVKMLVNGTNIANLSPQNRRVYGSDKGVSNNR